MATFDNIWTGASSNAWTTAGNWSGGVPALNGDAMIPKGTWSIDTTGMTDQQYGILHVAEGFAGSIGTSGTRLTGSWTDIRHKGSGKLWFVDGAGTTSRVIIDGMPNADLADLSGAISTLVAVLSGKCTLASANTILARLEVGKRGGGADAMVTLDANSNAITLLNQWAGSIVSERLITTARVCSGLFQQKRGQAVTTLEVYPGASVFYESNSDIATVYGYGGLLDMIRNRNDDVAITSNLYLHPGFQFIEDANLINVSGSRYDWRN